MGNGAMGVLGGFLDEKSVANMNAVSKPDSGFHRVPEQLCQISKCPLQCKFKTDRNRLFCEAHFWSWALRFVEEVLFAMVDERALYELGGGMDMKFKSTQWEYGLMVSMGSHYTPPTTVMAVGKSTPGQLGIAALTTRWPMGTPTNIDRLKAEFRSKLIEYVQYVFDQMPRDAPCHVLLTISSPHGSLKASLDAAKIPLVGGRFGRYTLGSSNTIPCGDGSDILNSFSAAAPDNPMDEDEENNAMDVDEVKRDKFGRRVDAYGYPVDDFPESQNKTAYAVADEKGREAIRNEIALRRSGAQIYKPVTPYREYREVTDPAILDKPIAPREPPVKRQRLTSLRYQKASKAGKPRRARKKNY